MSSIKLESNASGTGIFTIQSPSSNTNRTISLPDATGTIITTAGGAAISGTTGAFTSTVGVGGATPAASGAGITFPASASASSDANTLDDYEEGTWTPQFAFGGGSVAMTFSEQAGVYVKVGQLVFCSIVVTFTNKGTSTGNCTITGLPFTIMNNVGSRGGGQFTYTLNGASITGSPTVLGSSNSTTCECFQSGTGTDLTQANFNNNTSVRAFVVYRANA
jgi:hypothetical protein